MAVHRSVAIVISLFCASLLSCSPNASNDLLIAQLDSTLVQVNKTTMRINEDILLGFEEKGREPITKEKAALWLPKVKRIDSLSTLLLAYLDSVKMSILSGHEKKKQIANIYPRLTAFKEAVLPIHEQMKNVSALNFQSNQTSASLSALFSDASLSESMALLTALKNQVLKATNGSLLFCLDQIVSHEHYISLDAMVGQNAKVLHVGDSLEITTGIGAFDRLKKSEILIDGKQMIKNYNGLVIYKIKTSNKPGYYSLPVSLNFTDEDGNPQRRTFNVEYRLVAY